MGDTVFTSVMAGATVVCKLYSPLMEFIVIKTRLFYLLRSILRVVVYIPPGPNNNRTEAQNKHYQHISEEQTAHP